MLVSPSVERLEIPLPSLLRIEGDCGQGVLTTSDHNRVFSIIRVRDSTGKPVNSTSTNLLIKFNTHNVSYSSMNPVSWVPSGLINVDVVLLAVPPMR